MFYKKLLAAFIAFFFISSALNSADLSNYTNANIDWKQFEGEDVTVLLSKHPWQEQIEPLIPEFEELTGINVKLKLLPENQYLTKVPADMEAGTFKFDVFMTQLYEAPKFCGENWLADLEPLINDPSVTDPNWYKYDETIIPGSFLVRTGMKKAELNEEMGIPEDCQPPAETDDASKKRVYKYCSPSSEIDKTAARRADRILNQGDSDKVTQEKSLPKYLIAYPIFLNAGFSHQKQVDGLQIILTSDIEKSSSYKGKKPEKPCMYTKWILLKYMNG